MAVLVDLLTLGELTIVSIDSDPRTGGGFSAAVGSFASVNNAGSPVGQMYLKTGAGDTAWYKLATVEEAGTTNSGVGGRLALYPTTGAAIDDVFVQNSQDIDVNVVAQPSRSAPIEYTIPNPGDAVTSANFVLTEGTQTINGAKTLGSNLSLGGNLITSLGSPVSGTDAANKAYVDGVAQGLDPKDSVLVATTADITLSGEQTLDGVLTSGSRVLVKNQTAPEENGIYVSSSGAWTRSLDMDSWAEVPSAFTFVEQGTTQGDTGWVCISDVGGTLNTTAIAWAQFSGSGTYTAGNGITLTGTQFSANLDANGAIEFNGAALRVKLNGSTLDRSSSGLKVADGGIFDLQINSAAAITLSKLAALTASKLLESNGSGVITVSTGSGFVKATSGTPSYQASISLTTDVSGVLPLANGGTNANLTAVAGAVAYSSGSALALSLAGTTGQALLSGGTGSPTWFTSSGVVKATSGVLSTSNVDLTTEVTGVLPVANGGTNSSTSLNNNRIMVSSGGAIVEAAALTNGQLLIGSTGSAPVAAAITGTTNQVSVANAAGSITLSTPQNIHTGATPTFAGINIINSTANYLIAQSVVSTTNATSTTVSTIPTSTDTTYHIKATIVGKRTGGSAGTAGDGAVYVREVKVKNIGGTLTLTNLQSSFTSEDQVGFNGTIIASGTNILVRVTGAANNNIDWSCTYEVISI